MNACPTCKTKITRRDVSGDETMDKIASAFAELYSHRDTIVSAVKNQDASFLRATHDAIPWAQGVDDDALSLQSKSEVCTAMEELRRETSPSIAINRAFNKAGNASVQADKERNENDKRNSNCTPCTEAKISDSVVPEQNVPIASSSRSKSRKRTQEESVLSSGDKKRKGGLPDQMSPAGECAKNVVSGANDSISKGILTESNKKISVNETPHTKLKPFWDANQASSASGTEPSCSLFGAEMPQLDDIVANLNEDEIKSPHESIVQSSKAKGLDKRRNTANKKATTRGKPKKNRANDTTSPSEKEKNSDTAAKRRIPTRLLPWNCELCTFENKGADNSCKMCGIARSEISSPAAVAATAAAQLQAVRDSSEIAKTSARIRKSGTDSNARKKPEKSCSPLVQAKLTAKKVKRKNTLDSEESKSKTKTSRKSNELANKKCSDENRNAQQQSNIVTEERKNRRKWKSKQCWVLLGSALDAEAREQLKNLADISGSILAESWSSDVTHVICGHIQGESNESVPSSHLTARRTFKFMMGILHGSWILSQDWVSDCLSQSKPIEERKYEIQRDSLGCAGGASKARKHLDKEKGTLQIKEGLGNRKSHSNNTGAVGKRTSIPGANLLKGYEVYLQGDFSGKNKQHLLDILSASGAKILKRLPVQGIPKSCLSSDCAPDGEGGLILLEVPESGEVKEKNFRAIVAAEPWFAHAKGANVPVISHKWVTDSISQFALRPLKEYVLM